MKIRINNLRSNLIDEIKSIFPKVVTPVQEGDLIDAFIMNASWNDLVKLNKFGLKFTNIIESEIYPDTSQEYQEG